MRGVINAHSVSTDTIWPYMIMHYNQTHNNMILKINAYLFNQWSTWTKEHTKLGMITGWGGKDWNVIQMVVFENQCMGEGHMQGL